MLNAIHERTNAADIEAPAPTAKLLPGARLLLDLRAAGIVASSVIRNRRTGVLTVKFAAPDISDFTSQTDPAKVWAERILNAVDGYEVVDTYDSLAEWRNPTNPPVLYATVFLRAKVA